MITREQILKALVEAVEPLEFAYAMWEGGAAAFERVDEWSDIDLQIDAADERVMDIFPIVEGALERLSPIQLVYEIPQPSWHGHAQKFYRLQDASEYLLVDLAVIKDSNSNKFLEPEIHGNAKVLFDKKKVVQSEPMDMQAHANRLRERVGTLKLLFDLFQILPLKEVKRGNDLEAIAFYHSYTLRALVEALRIRYTPTRYNFYTRYTHYELPQEVVERLVWLYYVRDLDDLREKHQEAVAWFHEAVAWLEAEAS